MFFKKLGWTGAQVAVFISLCAFFAFLLFFQIELPVADDMARHLVNGREVLHGNFDVLYKNVYSFTMPNAPFVNHHWLFGVITYPLYKIIGWSGLVIFKIIVLLSAFVLLFLTALRRGGFWPAAIFSIPTILILVERGALRPEMFSYLFIALFLFMLYRLEEEPENKKILYSLVPAQILWVNMHIFFILGPVLVAGFLFEKIVLNFREWRTNLLIRRLSILFGTLVLACLINPNGWQGALLPFRIFSNYGIGVSENQSILSFVQGSPFWFNMPLLSFWFTVGLLGVAFLINIRRQSKNLFLVLGSTATAILGFVLFRSIVLFAFMFLPAIAGETGKWFADLEAKKNGGKILAGVLIFVMFFLVLLKITGKAFDDVKIGIGLTETSNDAADFFLEAGLEGPIFNDYDSGSYLIHNFYPKEKVFVDNRPEAYSEDFFSSSYLPSFLDENTWQNLLRTYEFNTIFFYRYDEGNGVQDFLYHRLNDPEWALIYMDMYAIIFVRDNEANKEIVEKYKITSENIESRMQYLTDSTNMQYMVAAADNFNFVGRTDLGMKTFFDVVERWPSKGKIWMVMGEWELGADNPKSPLLALSYLQKAIDVGYGTAEAYTFLGAAYNRIGYQAKAVQALEKALRINPNREDAKEILENIKKDSGLIQ